MTVTLLGSEVFADDQVKVGSLGWALIQRDYVLIKSRNLDAEGAQREDDVRHREDVGCKPRHA